MFSFSVVFCLLLFVLLCSVTAQILLVTDFYGIGSMFIYPKIKTALNGFILPYTAIPIFYHILPYFDKNFTKWGHRYIVKNFTIKNGGSLFGGASIRGCVANANCCSHRGYVGTLNCCIKKYRPSLLNGISIIIYHFQVGILYTPI